MIVARALLRTPAGENGVIVTRSQVTDMSTQTRSELGQEETERRLYGKTITTFRVQNNASAHWFELVFDEENLYIIQDTETEG